MLIIMTFVDMEEQRLGPWTRLGCDAMVSGDHATGPSLRAAVEHSRGCGRSVLRRERHFLFTPTEGKLVYKHIQLYKIHCKPQLA